MRNDPELYGAITAQAVARPEADAPDRARTFSLAVTATDERDRGQPTSWSAALDALAVGRSFDPTTQGLVYLDDGETIERRLFVVSAGNVVNLDVAHLDRSDLEAVHDPAHAWNPLTVGAYTEKSIVTDPSWNGWSGLSQPGELSPWSTTSVSFQDVWPIKPDVVFEGGNVGRNGKTLDFPVPDLCLLSTYYKPADKTLALSWATSAATAQVARIAAITRAEYSDLWPETVRALIVHSARWTNTMQAHLGSGAGKRARLNLARRYGYGVPDLQRTMRSANDCLTLMVQSSIVPFFNGKMNEMHVHDLPWPKEVLGQLGQIAVRLRVTLSYFVEPNPARRGWKKRHRYASHGLRFDVKSATESTSEFRKRLNQRALDEDEERPVTGDSDGWFFGGARAQKRLSAFGRLDRNGRGSCGARSDRSVSCLRLVEGSAKARPQCSRCSIRSCRQHRNRRGRSRRLDAGRGGDRGTCGDRIVAATRGCQHFDRGAPSISRPAQELLKRLDVFVRRHRVRRRSARMPSAISAG